MRGYHVSAHWSSAYVRQDYGVELDFCRDTQAAGLVIAGTLLARLEQEIRPGLPAWLERNDRAIPRYRWDWYLADAELGGGGHGHHHHH